MIFNYWIPVSILIIAVCLSIAGGKLNVPGAIVGGVIGFFIFAGAGYAGLAMLATFFILGSAATSWKSDLKTMSGLAEKNNGRRTTLQVVANGGIAGLLGFLSWVLPEKSDVMCLMMSASLAAATADTLSSEMGNVYGRKFYNILSLRKDKKGLNGVVSLEGSLIGMMGSIIIAIIFAFAFGWNINVVWVIITGTMGNLADSLLGATFERKGYLHNNAVNFLNTLISALAALALYIL